MAKKKIKLYEPECISVEVVFKRELTMEEIEEFYQGVNREFKRWRIRKPQIVGAGQSATKERKARMTFWVVVTDADASPRDATRAVHWALKDLYPNEY